VTMLGIDRAKEFLKETVEKALKALEGMENSEFLADTAVFIAEREK
jgi:hypothetical protein